MTEEKIRLLSKTAINPLRIAFDHIKDTEIYTEKIKLVSFQMFYSSKNM